MVIPLLANHGTPLNLLGIRKKSTSSWATMITPQIKRDLLSLFILSPYWEIGLRKVSGIYLHDHHESFFFPHSTLEDSHG